MSLDDLRKHLVTILTVAALIVGAFGVWFVAGKFFKPQIQLQETRADNEGMTADRRENEQDAKSRLDQMTGDFRAQNTSARVSQERTNARIAQSPSSDQAVPDDVVDLLREHDQRLRSILQERESRSGDSGANSSPR